MTRSQDRDGRPGDDLTRRAFLRGAAASAGLVLASPKLSRGGEEPPGGALQLALVGAGSQGRNLLTRCLKIPGVRFAAVCDIWPYHQRYAANILKKYGQPVRVYTEVGEMLAAEKDVDAVVIATPDWVHAEQSVACLRAGKHVYCEKEMSNTLEGARRMVLAARETKKLLQIGHQRRSNPRYRHALALVRKDRILGNVTHFYGQWNRARRLDLGWPKKEALDQATLERYGYGSMERLRNWRWYRRYSGGPMADLGSHQVDVFNWFLGGPPRSVLASGGRDYYHDREWYDNVMAIYEYALEGRTVRGFYQVVNTSSHGGYYETFLGDEGSLVVSEDPRKGRIFREVQAEPREWEDEASRVESMGREAIELKVGESLSPEGPGGEAARRLLDDVRKPVHQLHLENFFRAIREGTPLSCPPEVGFETAVSVLRANDAVAARRPVDFEPGEFRA